MFEAFDSETNLKDDLVQHLFSDSVANYPDQPAIILENDATLYQQLNERARDNWKLIPNIGSTIENSIYLWS